MSRTAWHILRDGPALTLARRVPARFDIAAETRLPAAGRLRVAQQIRQDVWRALRRQKGFSPVVEVISDADGLSVRAGGSVEARNFDRPYLEARIAEVLASPANRNRWVRSAAGGAR